jgi:inosose dehydratase
MTSRLSRRAFAKTLAAGVGVAAFPFETAAKEETPRKLKIGCTALIWGAVPRTPENLTAAVRDMASIGFHGFETFASIVNDWDVKGTLAPLIEEHRLPLISAYSSVQLTDTSTRKENLA